MAGLNAMATERITVVDSHTAGEPFRVVTGGIGPIPGATIVAKRTWAESHLDGVRRRLMWEPRGHADMYGCFVTEPVTPGAAFGVLFMHNAGFSTMCGHGIIALATVAVETGMVPVEEPETVIRIDAPAGLIEATVSVAGGRTTGVRFRNVPSFALALDQTIDVPGLGPVRYDLGFGGAFYAYVDAPSLGLTLEPDRAQALIHAGRRIKEAVMAARPIPHPFEPTLSFLYGTIFTGPARGPEGHSRHVCIFAEGELDRSPTGTGVSGRLALLAARGQLDAGRRIRIESILGTSFGGRIIEATRFGPYDAIIPEVDGAAYLVGRSELWADPADPLKDGFCIR